MALYCDPISGNINKECGSKRGGLIQTVYALNFSDLSGTTFTSSEITQIDTVTGTPFNQIAFKKNSAVMNNEAVIGDNNKFFNQTLTLTFEGMDTQTKSSFETLIDGQAVFIGVDYQGVAHFLGRVNGAEMSEGNIGTGQAAADLYGGTFTFLAEENEVTPTVAVGTTINYYDEDGITVLVKTF